MRVKELGECPRGRLVHTIEVIEYLEEDRLILKLDEKWVFESHAYEVDCWLKELVTIIGSVSKEEWVVEYWTAEYVTDATLEKRW